MRNVLYALILASIIAFHPCTSSAQKHKTSITISPLHLMFPVVEITGEFSVAPSVGVAAIAGVGSYEGYTVFNIGGQYNYYLVGNFQHGMQLGAELMYMHVSDNYDFADEKISAAARGLSLGALLGYKVAGDFGLTLNIQAGGALLLIRAEAESSSSGAYASRAGSDFSPLLNINIGWSF